MKEAAGEANMTVITIVLIGVVAAVGLLLVPRLMSDIRIKACCTDGGWFVSGRSCCRPDNPNCSESKINNEWARIGFEAFKTTTLYGFNECMQD